MYFLINYYIVLAFFFSCHIIAQALLTVRNTFYSQQKPSRKYNCYVNLLYCLYGWLMIPPEFFFSLLLWLFGAYLSYFPISHQMLVCWLAHEQERTTTSITRVNIIVWMTWEFKNTHLSLNYFNKSEICGAINPNYALIIHNLPFFYSILL